MTEPNERDKAKAQEILDAYNAEGNTIREQILAGIVTYRLELTAERDKTIEAQQRIIKIKNDSLADSRAEVERLSVALETISTTFPSKLGMNMNARTSDPEYIKMSNNHMVIAREALASVPKVEAVKDE